jgi:Leucine-rich repeat (LRR) protein
MGPCLSTPAPPPPTAYPNVDHSWNCPKPELKPVDEQSDEDVLKILRYLSPNIAKERESWRSEDISTWQGIGVSDGRVTALEIDRCWIGSFPGQAHLGRLTELTHFSCAGNNLTDLPESLADCVKIVKCECHGNDFVKIPEACYAWKNMYFFNISVTKLGPDGVSPRVKELESVQLFALDVNTRLTKLPREILEMKSLNNLICDATGMAEAPDFLAPLKERGCKMSFSYRAPEGE